MPDQFADQGMQLPAGEVHVRCAAGFVQTPQLPLEFGRMAGLYARLAACLEERLQPFVPECFNHGLLYSVAFHMSSGFFRFSSGAASRLSDFQYHALNRLGVGNAFFGHFGMGIHTQHSFKRVVQALFNNIRESEAAKSLHQIITSP